MLFIRVCYRQTCGAEAPINVPLNIALRVAFGTGLFALIVWTAARFPAAAGLMLTFPALNGLAFIFSRHDMVGPMTATMLWMPLLNGVLCVAYMTAFIALATAEHATALAWGLAAVFAFLWLVAATRAWLQGGVPARLQQAYAASVALVGAALTLAWWRFMDTGGADTAGAAKTALTWLKVALFAIALTLLIVLPPRFKWKGGASGILSGLPLVVLAGLLNVAQDGAIHFEVRRALLAQMLLGAWLAPAMAVAFIFGVSRVVASPRGHELRAAVVVAGWVFCLAAIVVTGAALGRLGGSAP